MGKTGNTPCTAPPRQVNLSALRGKVAAPRARGQAPTPEPPTEPSPEQTPADDRTLMRAIAAQPAEEVKLDVGATLVRRDANNREYRGVIQLGRRGLHRRYLGITQWGPSGRVSSQQKIVYEGESLEEAERAVNNMIQTKLAKGYQPGQGDGMVSALRARGAARQLLTTG